MTQQSGAHTKLSVGCGKMTPSAVITVVVHLRPDLSSISINEPFL